MNILNSKSTIEHIENSNCTIEIIDVNVNMNVNIDNWNYNVHGGHIKLVI